MVIPVFAASVHTAEGVPLLDSELIHYCGVANLTPTIRTHRELTPLSYKSAYLATIKCQ